MVDKETLKVLSEIRDEMKEMNAQFKWLIEKASTAMEKEETSGGLQLKEIEFQNKKSRREMILMLLFGAGLLAAIVLEKYGYI
ncbi:hypothetical protein BTA51_14165 [Hahella sp. CCB-MM4]|uniref:hypothetical protein n=1 Tax=Hahella sp. (strain CCB-MM4) TaxID=1926491 RepID=UPI000B9BE97F|nr:hypothetical protein [Hahella sp. CCB-MM4]OZG72670.1 hypothetical protein BTA51_14165 [Hahella sp. CCB-MM4]